VRLRREWGIHKNWILAVIAAIAILSLIYEIMVNGGSTLWRRKSHIKPLFCKNGSDRIYDHDITEEECKAAGHSD